MPLPSRKEMVDGRKTVATSTVLASSELLELGQKKQGRTQVSLGVALAVDSKHGTGIEKPTCSGYFFLSQIPVPHISGRQRLVTVPPPLKLTVLEGQVLLEWSALSVSYF